jgi:hypothetical protein
MREPEYRAALAEHLRVTDTGFAVTENLAHNVQPLRRPNGQNYEKHTRKYLWGDYWWCQDMAFDLLGQFFHLEIEQMDAIAGTPRSSAACWSRPSRTWWRLSMADLELPDIRLSVMEAVYFDTVVHAMGKYFCLDDDWKEGVMREANFAGRQYCTSQDVRDIYLCMDLGLSTVECTKYLHERRRQELLEIA